MYEYELIENELNTKYIGRVFLQFENIESTTSKCRNISQTCPSGMLVLTEDDMEGNTYLNKDLKNFKNKVLMSLILKLDRNNINKEHAESLTNCVGVASLLSVGEEYFQDLVYYWEKVVKGKEFLAEVDSHKSLKSNDKSIILSLRIYYNAEINREVLIGRLLNKIEKNINLTFVKNQREDVIDICSSFLKSKDTYIQVNKKNRKTVKIIENIQLNLEGNLSGKHKSEDIYINWKDYEVEWCD